MELSSEAFTRSVLAAQDLLRRSGITSPPVNIERIAETLGFRVVLLYSVPDEVSGIVSPKHRLIGINGNHHPHRRRFTLAHEIGHVVLHHPPERRCASAQIALFNRAADAFASEVLIPTGILRSLLRSIEHVAPLASLFNVSEQAMEVKLRELPFYVQTASKIQQNAPNSKIVT